MRKKLQTYYGVVAYKADKTPIKRAFHGRSKADAKARYFALSVLLSSSTASRSTDFNISRFSESSVFLASILATIFFLSTIFAASCRRASFRLCEYSFEGRKDHTTAFSGSIHIMRSGQYSRPSWFLQISSSSWLCRSQNNESCHERDFPADNPKYSCIVAIKTYYGPGSYHTYYGASLSGPVFRAIADRVYASGEAWQQPVTGEGDRHPAPARNVPPAALRRRNAVRSAR